MVSEAHAKIFSNIKVAGDWKTFRKILTEVRGIYLILMALSYLPKSWFLGDFQTLD